MVRMIPTSYLREVCLSPLSLDLRCVPGVLPVRLVWPAPLTLAYSISFSSMEVRFGLLHVPSWVFLPLFETPFTSVLEFF